MVCPEVLPIRPVALLRKWTSSSDVCRFASVYGSALQADQGSMLERREHSDRLYNV